MSDSHHARAHAQWSASATARNCVCPGALAMSSLCEDVEREAAAWGTCCHEAAQRCFNDHKDAASLIVETFKIGKFEFVFDEEMANTTQAYVDYCRDRLDEYRFKTGHEAEFWIEHPLSLERLDPPLQAGGTGDFIIWFPQWKLLEVIDLKGGRGVTVDVVGNPQGRSYAIGAILSLPDIKPEQVMVTIVQPRVGDGKPKSDQFHVTELLDWSADLLEHMSRAKTALDEFETLGDNRVKFDEWAQRWLRPGQCTFCTAKPICPALRKKALDAMPVFAREWHEDVTLVTPPALSNQAKIGSPEELAHDLDGFDELEGWIKARRAYAHSQAENGVDIPGYHLVEKIGNRSFIEKDEKKLEAALWNALKLKHDDVFVAPSIKSVAQIEKALGKRKAELAKLEGRLWEKPIRGTNLVASAKTTRPAIKSAAESFHEDV